MTTSIQICTLTQVINGVQQAGMGANITFTPAIVPFTSSIGTLTATSNDATLSGNYTYTAGAQAAVNGAGNPGSIALCISCTIAGQGGNPAAGTSTIYSGIGYDGTDQNYLGSLQGVPPALGGAPVGAFATGSFMLSIPNPPAY